MKRFHCHRCGGVIEESELRCRRCGAEPICFFCGKEDVAEIVATRFFSFLVCGDCRESIEQYAVFFCLNCRNITVLTWKDLERQHKDLYDYLEFFKKECEKAKTFGMLSFRECFSCCESNVTDFLKEGFQIDLKRHVN